MLNPIPYNQTRGCFSLESFTRRSCYCNGRSMYNSMSLSSLGILPSLPQMEDTAYQQQAIHAIAMKPHFILDPSEMNVKE